MRDTKVLLSTGVLLILLVCGPLILTSFSTTPSYALSDAYLQANQIGGSNVGYGYANSTGQYLIDQGIGVGDYAVKASSNGYIDETINTTIASISDTKTVDFLLNRSAIIWGKVLGHSGQPVIGAFVDLKENSTGTYVNSATTDSDGQYYFATDIDTGAYYVTVDFSFSNFESSYLDAPYLANGYVGNVQSTAVAVTAGSTAQIPDLVLNMSGVITGTVTDDHGNPIANATVTAMNVGTFHSSTVSADTNGVYRISYDIVDSNYSVEANSNGYVSDTSYVNAIQGSTVVQNVTMHPSATLHGTVLRQSDNKPIPDASISLFSDDFKYFGDATSNELGSYAINDGLGADNYTATLYLNGELQNESQGITLDYGQNITLDFTIQAYFISGKVNENSTTGPAVHDPHVDLTFEADPSPPGGSTSGDTNGNYEMTLPTGSLYGADYTGQEWNGTFTASADGYNTTTVNATITIGADMTIDFVLFKQSTLKPPSATIVGTIYGNAGPSLPFSHQVWHLVSGASNFEVELNTSSSTVFLDGNVTTGTVSIYLWGPEGTTGQLTIWIPKNLFPGPSFTVTSYPGPNPTPSLASNSTHWIITIQYEHSFRDITFKSQQVLPEYPIPAILMVMLMVSSALAFLEKKRRTRISR